MMAIAYQIARINPAWVLEIRDQLMDARVPFISSRGEERERRKLGANSTAELGMRCRRRRQFRPEASKQRGHVFNARGPSLSRSRRDDKARFDARRVGAPSSRAADTKKHDRATIRVPHITLTLVGIRQAQAYTILVAGREGNRRGVIPPC